MENIEQMVKERCERFDCFIAIYRTHVHSMIMKEDFSLDADSESQSKSKKNVDDRPKENSTALWVSLVDSLSQPRYHMRWFTSSLLAIPRKFYSYSNSKTTAVEMVEGKEIDDDDNTKECLNSLPGQVRSDCIYADQCGSSDRNC